MAQLIPIIALIAAIRKEKIERNVTPAGRATGIALALICAPAAALDGAPGTDGAVEVETGNGDPTLAVAAISGELDKTPMFAGFPQRGQNRASASTAVPQAWQNDITTSDDRGEIHAFLARCQQP